MMDLINNLNSTDAEAIVYGEPATYGDPDTVPTVEDEAWYVGWVLAGGEAEYAEAHSDWYHGAQTEGQARYLNSGL